MLGVLTITYNTISSSDWEAFSSDIVGGIVQEYLSHDFPDYIRLRWFFRRLSQVGHPGALQVILDNVDALLPCLPNICAYISSIQSIPTEDWVGIGANLLQLLESNESFSNENEFARLSVLSLFTRNKQINHFPKIASLFSSSDLYARREILLATQVNGAGDWLREHKEDFSSMDRWQQMAFLYCSSSLPQDEKRFFLRGKGTACPFDEHLVKWARSSTSI